MQVQAVQDRDDPSPLSILSPRDFALPGVPFSEVLRSIAPVAATQSAVSRASSSYSVQPGDTLSSICRTCLEKDRSQPSPQAVHDAALRVARANGLSNPNLILPGRKLDLSVLQPAGAVSSDQATSPVMLKAWSEPEVVALARAYTDAVLSPVRNAKESPAKGSSSPQAPVPGRRKLTLEDLVHRVLKRPERSADTQPADALPAEKMWEPILEQAARLTSQFGARRDPFTGAPSHHHGIDLAAERGTRIFPWKPGEVVFSGWKTGYGKVVVIRHDDGLETLYGHNTKNLVQKGDRVTPTTALGLVGATGRTTGPHLHFEVRQKGRAVDPVPLLKQDSLQIAKAF
ncbi:MAG: M23 family metallopeptidase [Candidatus Hydrogenedentes bacterium]|nr:M23 family metallopeptidase [Candidatus Hydrogenedentota bacterium]